MEEELLTCTNKNHTSHSKYKKNEVPIHLFRQIANNPNSKLLKHCLDCRIYGRDEATKRREKRKNTVLEENTFMCSQCHLVKPEESRCTLKTGSKGDTCEMCSIILSERRKEIQSHLNNIKMDRIRQVRCACEKCNCMFLKPNEDGIVIIIPITNNEVVHKGEVYNFDEFLFKFESEVELRILQFDHLTEEEQRSRGILQPKDIFVPKVSKVSGIRSKDSMLLESKKCQLVCMKCHLEETIRRHKKVNSPSSILLQQKRKFVNDFKLKSEGCNNCHNHFPDLLQFLDFDHHDPKTKICKISTMVIGNIYTIVNITEEIAKCRLLCKFCHQIHTKKQIAEGKINTKGGKKIKLDN